MQGTQLKEGFKNDLNVQGSDKAAGADSWFHQSTEYVAASVSKRFFTATRPCRVKSIHGTNTVIGTGGAATAVIRKVPSGTAMASGTLLHTGTYNLVGTAETEQVLTLSTTPSDLLMAKGDSLAIIFTGTLTSATGVLTVGLSPS